MLLIQPLMAPLLPPSAAQPPDRGEAPRNGHKGNLAGTEESCAAGLSPLPKCHAQHL